MTKYLLTWLFFTQLQPDSLLKKQKIKLFSETRYPKSVRLCPKCYSNKEVVPVVYGCYISAENWYWVQQGKLKIGTGPRGAGMTSISKSYCKKDKLEF